MTWPSFLPLKNVFRRRIVGTSWFYNVVNGRFGGLFTTILLRWISRYIPAEYNEDLTPTTEMAIARQRIWEVMKVKKKAIGSSFDDFLKQEGDYETSQAVAVKRVLAWQIQKAMKQKHLKYEKTKS